MTYDPEGNRGRSPFEDMSREKVLRRGEAMPLPEEVMTELMAWVKDPEWLPPTDEARSMMLIMTADNLMAALMMKELHSQAVTMGNLLGARAAVSDSFESLVRDRRRKFFDDTLGVPRPGTLQIYGKALTNAAMILTTKKRGKSLKVYNEIPATDIDRRGLKPEDFTRIRGYLQQLHPDFPEFLLATARKFDPTNEMAPLAVFEGSCHMLQLLLRSFEILQLEEMRLDQD